MYSDLKNILKNYKQNLYDLQECLIPIKEIAEKSAKINKTSHKLILARIQYIFIDHFILNLCKLYDPTSSTYPTVSIPHILNYLQCNETDLTKLDLKDRSDVFFQKIGPLRLIEDSIIKSICSHYRQEIEKRKYILEAIKERRDKVIAHNESIDPEELSTIFYKDTIELKILAEDFRNCIDYCFFNHSGDPITDLGSLKESMKGLIEIIIKE